ncbi:ER lumen protein-retaining receptor, partial [Mucuna pruriens]
MNEYHLIFPIIFQLCVTNYSKILKLSSSVKKELTQAFKWFQVVPSAILAIIIHPYATHWSLTRIIWAFSLYLEAVSVLPQLRFMQNAKMIETFTGYYVFALGVSRFVALAYWLIRTYESRGAYLFLAGSGYFWFLAAFLAEMVQSFILADFCYYYMKRYVYLFPLFWMASTLKLKIYI